MTTIFQVIGKPESYQEKEFIIDGDSYKTCLCSDALRKHLKKEGGAAELVVFVPESMLLGEDLDSFCRKLNDRGVEDFEAVIIPSVGRYSNGGEEVDFRGSVETITTAILIHLLRRRPENLLIDLSTGFNIYPVSLLEATKRYLTYRKMERILQDQPGVSAKAVFTPPVTRDVWHYAVEIQPLDVKAFFSLPGANIDRVVGKCPESLKTKLAEINRGSAEVKREFRRMYEELVLAYNAVRLNVPLAFYELLKMDVSVDDLERRILDFVEKFLEPYRDGETVERFPVDGVNVSGIFYAIAMFRSLKEFRKSLHEPEVGEILDKFSVVYRNRHLGLGVNEYFLQRDIEEVVDLADKLGDGEQEILGILKHGKEFCKSRVEKRNFFAHSGFLKEFTVVRKEGGRVMVGWMEDRLREIKSWILNPDKN
ncbi:TM1812 family CRISPR-associated protein [Geoglobus sp.]